MSSYRSHKEKTLLEQVERAKALVSEGGEPT